MIYVDTSVLIALHLHESNSEIAAKWYAKCAQPLASAFWCVTEFASALGIKQRIGQIDATQAAGAWARFGRQCSSDLQLIAVGPRLFHAAALLTLEPSSKLRSGDALHLACAIEANVNSIATFDEALANNATRMKLKLTFG
jgi:uncharacterized protein